MCEPITATTLALTAASSAASYAGQRQQAASMQAAQDANHASGKAHARAANERAMKQYRADIEATHIRAQEEQTAAGLNKAKVNQSTRQSLAKLRALQAEFGVAGASGEAVKANVRAMGAQERVGIDRQHDAIRGQLERQLSGLAPDLVSGPQKQPKVQGPSFLALGLDLATASVGSFRHSSQLTGRTLGQSWDAFKAGEAWDFGALSQTALSQS